MADSNHVTRRTAVAETTKPSHGLLRMALVITSSIAILISIPGWLRSLDHGPLLPGSIHDPSVPGLLETQSAPPKSVVSMPNKEVVRHGALADSLAKRYRVSRDAVERFILHAYSAGQVTRVDPLLILAVIAVESNFNPIAESVMGAKGLMQIIPEYHQDKLRSAHGAELNVLDPEINILAGAKVLREYTTRTGEDIAAALRLYGGTGADPASSYPDKVLSERQRLEQLLHRIQERKAPHSAPARSSI